MRHLARYPRMQVQDAVKLLYQSEFGGGHMIADSAESLKRLCEEWVSVRKSGGESRRLQGEALQKQITEDTIGPGQETTGPLIHQSPDRCMQKPSFEKIGDGLCRMNLSVLDEGLAPETLNRMFVATAGRAAGTAGGFEEKLEMLRRCCAQGETPFLLEELDRYLSEYRDRGYPAVSHSEIYRQNYHPAYRVVDEYYAEYLQAFIEIDRLMASAKNCEKAPAEGAGTAGSSRENPHGAAGRRTYLAAIDGMCGSGKSTMARLLQEIYGCRLFHMDDYFLRPEQRTKERYVQPGGNVDYERFQEEVLDHIGDPKGLAYRPFDCGRLALGPPVEAGWSSLNIIEGSYSQHPCFGDVYDLRFFCRVSEEEQRRRILARNGPAMWEKFEKQWIPMENRYFDAFGIREKSIQVSGES